MRGVLGFGPRWAATQDGWEAALCTLRQRMEEAGTVVVTNGVVGNNTRRTLDVDEFRGFVLVDEYVPFVFVNNRDAKAAQMFTLAHELAHVVYGSSASFDLRSLQPARDDTERACNRAAAEFLVPAREVRRVWNDVRDAPNPYSVLAQRFKVSVIVAARRALDVRLITTTGNVVNDGKAAALPAAGISTTTSTCVWGDGSRPRWSAKRKAARCPIRRRTG